MSTSEQIAALVEPVLSAAGADLYDVELTGATVRVLVSGASMEVLERVSPLVSEALDAADVMPDISFLEVSSPGLERPLRRPDHFAGALGDTVKIKTRSGVDGDRRVEGELTAADDEGIIVARVGGAVRRLAYGDIDTARTVYVWPGQAKPGKPGTPKSQSQRSGTKQRSSS